MQITKTPGSQQVLLILQVVLGISVSTIWLYLWRYPIWSIDDLYFVTRDGYAWGATTFTDLRNDFTYDVFQRNGRTADLVLQLIFSATTDLWLVFPIICLAFSIAVYFFTKLHIPKEDFPARGSGLQTVLFIFSALSLFIISAFAQDTPGTTIMFMAAAVGYLGGFILLTVTVALLHQLSSREDFKWPVFFLLATAVTAWHHEVIAGLLFAYFLLFFSTQKADRLTTKATLVVALLILIARFATPGIWQRRGNPQELFPHDSVIITKVSAFVFHFHAHVTSHRKLWLVVLATILVVTYLIHMLFKKEKQGLRVLFFANVVTLVLIVFSIERLKLAKLNAAANKESFAPIFQSKTSLVLFFAFLLHLVLMLCFFWLIRKSKFKFALLPLAVAYTGMLLALLAGSPADRPMFFTHSLLLVFFLVGLTISFRIANLKGFQKSHAITCLLAQTSLILLTLAVFGSSLMPSVAFLTGVNKNVLVQKQIQTEILQVRTGEKSSFRLPQQYPLTKYFTWYHPRDSVKERYIQYYDLPSSTTVVVVPAEELK